MATQRAGGALTGIIEAAATSGVVHTVLGGAVYTDLLNSFNGGTVQTTKCLDGRFFPLGDVIDTVLPVLSNLTPAPGATVNQTTAIQFDITDNGTLKLVEVQVDQTMREVAYDGEQFLYPYAGSSKVAIANGYTFQIRRTGGWIKAPTIHLRALDPAFNEPLSPS